MPELAPVMWALAIAITLIGGFVKGSVGFAMPMVMISGLGSFLDPQTALAALILPTLLTNMFQALRGGVSAALASARVHWRYIAAVFLVIGLSAQLVGILSDRAMFLMIGVPVVFFAGLQLAGVGLVVPAKGRRVVEVATGAVAGFIGGLSGVWGPPTVLWLTALQTAKVEQIRVQGLVYGLGSVMLTAAHLRSGVLNAETAPLSALLLPPALLGLAVGFRVSDALDQERFRRATLFVLLIAGANLVRRAVTL